MNWQIEYSKHAVKFIKKNNSQGIVKDSMRKYIKYIDGEIINIDLKKLSGNWLGFYRIRKGKIRIIFKVDRDEKLISIEVVDFRGSVY